MKRYRFNSKATDVILTVSSFIFVLFLLLILTVEQGWGCFITIFLMWIFYLCLKQKINTSFAYTVYDLDENKAIFILETKHSLHKGDILAIRFEGDFKVEKASPVFIPLYASSEEKIETFVDPDCPSGVLEVRRVENSK